MLKNVSISETVELGESEGQRVVLKEQRKSIWHQNWNNVMFEAAQRFDWQAGLQPHLAV